MIKNKRSVICLILFLGINLLAVNAFAGLLGWATPNAYNDGVKTWAGVTSFYTQDPLNPNKVLSGSVEWAVFAPGKFTASGYTTTPNEFTYTYQIFQTGSDDISSYTVYMQNPADNIGSFTATDGINTVSGLAPTGTDLVSGDSAVWHFSNFLPGASSTGLAFSSPYAPIDLYSGVLDGGLFSVAQPVPSPGTYQIPEPSSMALLLVSLGFAGMVATKRRFSR